MNAKERRRAAREHLQTIPYVEVAMVDGYQIEQVWPHVEGFFQNALEQVPSGADETTNHILEDLLDGSLTLWVAFRERTVLAAMTSYISTTRGGCRATIKHLGGTEMSGWFKHWPLVEQWAKGRGASRIYIKGRPAWAKVMESEGFTRDYVSLSKAI